MPNPRPLPIPPELETIALRLAHVDSLIEQMIDLSVAWSKSSPVTLELHRTADTDRAIVTRIRTTPPAIVLLFSDAIHQLRACLDNAVWHLVAAAGTRPSGPTATRVSFPVCEDEKRWREWSKSIERTGIAALAPGGKVSKRIHSLQPFVDTVSVVPERDVPILDALSGSTPESAHALLLLQRYSNLDKHRALTVTATHGHQSRGDIPLSRQRDQIKEIRVGSVVASFPARSLVPLEANHGFAVKRPEPWVGTPQIISELRRLYDYTRDVALPFLISGLFTPSPFPASINLGDSPTPVTQRISEGSWDTADKRFKRNLSRMISESLSQVPDVPKLVEHSPGEECEACRSTPM